MNAEGESALSGNLTASFHECWNFPPANKLLASYFAGYTGAALALKTWAWQLAHPGEQLPGIKTFTQQRGYYLNEEELLNQIKDDVATGEKISGRKPRVM